MLVSILRIGNRYRLHVTQHILAFSLERLPGGSAVCLSSGSHLCNVCTSPGCSWFLLPLLDLGKAGQTIKQYTQLKKKFVLFYFLRKVHLRFWTVSQLEVCTGKSYCCDCEPMHKNMHAHTALMHMQVERGPWPLILTVTVTGTLATAPPTVSILLFIYIWSTSKTDINVCFPHVYACTHTGTHILVIVFSVWLMILTVNNINSVEDLFFFCINKPKVCRFTSITIYLLPMLTISIQGLVFMIKSSWIFKYL